MSEHPLFILVRNLRGLRDSLRFLSNDLAQIKSIRSKWTLCFDDSGQLIGGVDRKRWDPMGDGTTTLAELEFERNRLLYESAIVSESEEHNCGVPCEGNKWDLEAEEYGIILPKLIRTVSLESAIFDVAHQAAIRQHQQSLAEPELLLRRMKDPDGLDAGASLHGDDVPALPIPITTKDATAIFDLSKLADKIRRSLEHLGLIRQLINEAEEAGQRLPKPVLEALDGLDKPGWRARLRKDVLMPIGGWLHPASEKLVRYPITDLQLDEALHAYNPSSEWGSHTRKVDIVLDDLIAVSSEVVPESTGANAPPKAEPNASRTAEPDSRDGRQTTSQTPSTYEWSREMTKTEAGKLLGCKGSDRSCRDHLESLLVAADYAIQSRSAKKHRFRLDWVDKVEPSAVAKFRPQ